MAGNRLRAIGERLRPVRAGFSTLTVNRAWIAAVPDCIRVTSPAFGGGRDMPVRYTSDGDGRSPPLTWDGLPAGTRALALLVEDPDIPFPVPLVHAIVHSIPAGLGALPDGALPYRMRGRAPEGYAMGRNGVSRAGWTPPSPPPGHGPHHYAFQMFALDALPRFDWPPGRGYLLRRLRPHMSGRGTLFGVYERA